MKYISFFIILLSILDCHQTKIDNKYEVKKKELHFQVGFDGELVKVYNDKDLIFQKKLFTSPQLGLADILKFKPKSNNILVVIDTDSLFFNSKCCDFHIISYNKQKHIIWYEHLTSNDSIIYD